MTNLQKHNNSARDAFDYYVNMDSVQESFVDWCDRPSTQPRHVEPKRPSWVKPGQWVHNKDGFDDYYVKIKDVTKTHVCFTNGSRAHIAKFLSPNSTYAPIVITPWNIQEAVDFCDSGVAVRFDGTIEKIYCVSKCEGHDEAKVTFANGQEYDLSELAKEAETDNFKPCGTAVPM